jgi:hypothetical protein
MPREVTGKIQLTPPFFIAIIGKQQKKKMSIKLVLLKSGETVITDAKQLVSSGKDEDEKQVHSYIFSKPHRVQVSRNSLVPVSEESSNIKESEVQVSLSPWILLTADDDIQVQLDWVVTIVDPIDSLLKMYQEKING